MFKPFIGFISLIIGIFVLSGLSFISGYELNYKVNNYQIANVQSINIGKSYKHVIIPVNGIIYDHCIFNDVIFLYVPTINSGIYIYNSTILGKDAIYGPSGSIFQFLDTQMQPYPDELKKKDKPKIEKKEPPIYEL